MKSIKRIASAIITTATFPASVAMAAPTSLDQGITTTQDLIGQGVQWFLILFTAGAVGFIIRAGLKISGADDEADMKQGKKMLGRSIGGLIIGILGNAIVAYVRNAYGM
ncbi:hypothetical protein [Alicyclobacillus macrosporangiidus]|uniref:TrbC/VIRB2 family protein n=1 Tax=Alicyclobacillus macrosporangiidus TaxID=392015 RepID=A0A1I7L2L5_9BACL|nr:hypothetical protein [Alicyclobacillus macrosporangiidus]SFV03858.1 hypothetical protein SAMN05421543_12351 [Alicyclobacillus macrosporangiidus]